MDGIKSSSTSERSFKSGSIIKIEDSTSISQIEEHSAQFGCKFTQRFSYDPTTPIGEVCYLFSKVITFLFLTQKMHKLGCGIVHSVT